ncbi:MAG: hypothetical protein ACRCTA_00770 [Bacilli bacterium]
MIALIDYLFVILKRNLPDNKKLIVTQVLLVLTALSLAGVGIFPYRDIKFYQMMHNRMAGMLVFLIILLILTLKWAIPTISKEFMRFSYLIISLLIISIFLFLGIGYLSLTAFELVAFLLSFSWILMLLSNLQTMVYHSNVKYQIKLKIKS